MSPATEDLKVGGLVVLNHYGVGHFRYITKRFRTRVEIEANTIKPRFKVIRDENGQPVHDKDGNVKLKRVAIKVIRKITQILKVEVQENAMQKVSTAGSGEGQARGSSPGPATGDEDSHGAVQADNGSGEHHARKADASLHQDRRDERKNKPDDFSGEGTA